MDVSELQLKADATDITKADKALDKLSKTSQKAESATDRLTKQNQKAADGYANLNKKLTQAVGGILAIGTAIAVMKKGISIIADFEAEMDTVAAKSRATGEEMQRMTAIARELGATTSFSATQAAQGLTFLAQAGFTAKESVAAIPNVLNLARASAMDLASAADIASNVMSGFGIEATDSANAVDILAGISSRANTDVFQLGEAAAYVGPVARAMGVELGTASAAIGVLSDAGIQGSSAGTGLRRVLSSLANPTKDAADVLKSLGVELESVNPATNDLTAIIDTLAGTGMDAAEALTIFGDRGGPAILALTANNDRVSQLATEMKNVSGEAERMAAEMGDNLTGDVRELESALSELALQLGDAGVESGMRSLTQSATEAARYFGFLTAEALAFFGVINDQDYARLADEAAKLEHLIRYRESIRDSPIRSALYGDQSRELPKLNEQLADVQARMNKIINLGPEFKQAFSEGLPELNKRLAAAGGLIDDAGVELQKMWRIANGKASEEATKAAEEFADSIQAIMDAADPAQAEVNKLTKEFELMDQALAQGLVTAEDYAKFMDYAFPEVVVEAKKLTAAVKEVEVAQTAMTVSFDRGVERMRDGIGDFFRDMIVDSEFSFGRVLDLFKGIVAEMVATVAANELLFQVGLGEKGQTSALTGSTSGLGSLFSSAGSAVSGLFGGGAGTASAGSAVSAGAGGSIVYNSSGAMVANTTATGTGAASAASTGGMGAAAGAGAFAALAIGIMRTIDDLQTGLYGPGDVLTGKSLNIKYGDSLGGLGQILFPDMEKVDFLGLGKFVNDLIGQKNDGNNSGTSTFDLLTGTADAVGHGKSFDQANVDMAAQLAEALQQFADALGGSELSGAITVGSQKGIVYKGTEYGSDTEAFLGEAYRDIINDAVLISDDIKPLITAFQGSTEELGMFALALSGLDAKSSAEAINAVAQANEEYAQSTELTELGVIGAYERSLQMVEDLALAYDDSAVSAENLNSAMEISRQTAYSMAQQINELSDNMSEMLGESATNIRESVMTEAQLFRLREEQRMEQFLLAGQTEDPIEFAEAAEEFNRLNNEMFAMLDNPTARDAEEYALAAEFAAALSEQKLDGILDKLEQTQSDQMDRVASALESSAARQEASTKTFADAVADFVNGVNKSNGNNEVVIA